MNPSGPNLPLWMATLGGLLVFGAAFAAPRGQRTTDPLGNYRPNNVHRAATALPADLRRVAILPLAAKPDSFELAEGRAALEPMLQTELAATKRFEVVRISPERMRARTGRPAWCGEEVLPANFFDAVHEESGCDAVLFCELTLFRAYAPLAVGWRLRLVDARSKETLWAADEYFDAAEPDVARGARRFDRRAADGWAMLNSPRRFGAYSAATLLNTLPRRTAAVSAHQSAYRSMLTRLGLDSLRVFPRRGPEEAPKVSLNHADDTDERRQ